MVLAPLEGSHLFPDVYSICSSRESVWQGERMANISEVRTPLREAELAGATNAMCAPRGAGPWVNTEAAASPHTCTRSTVTECAHAES